MGALLKEIWAILAALWNTGNRWIRTAIIIIVSWPIEILMVALIGSSLVTSLFVLLSFIAGVFLFIGFTDPLVIAAIAIFHRGRKGLRWLATIVGAEMLIGTYLSIIPITNNRGLVPLLVIVCASLLFFCLGVARRGVRTMKVILFTLILILTASFFLPRCFKLVSTMPTKADKAIFSAFNSERHKEAHCDQKTFSHQQVFEIIIPSDSTVIIDGVLARKNDIIKFSQIGPPKEFFWIGRENAVRITTSVYYGKVWIGNDEENRELQIWVKGGKEGDVKLRVEIIPHS